MAAASRFAAIALGSLFAGFAAAGARAQDVPVYEYYDHYDVGYDTNYDDDWFFDYYEYAPEGADPEYDYYTDYDYEGDQFDWEQPGVVPQ